MSEHLDLDSLADVLAGELTSPHLDTCAVCAAELAELETALGSVRSVLAALPEPVLPDDLVARIDAALARERRATDAPGARNVVPLVAKRSGPPRWVLASGSIAAAAVLVVGGVLLLGGGASNDSATTTAGTAAGIARSSTGAAYGKDGKALAAALPALLKGNADAAPQALSAPKAYGATESSPSRTADSATTATQAAPADPLAALREPAGLAACLASLSDPSDAGVPLALDYASFDDKPALVVVLPTTAATKVDVFVVGAGCAQADSKLLFYTRLAKP